MVSPVLCYTAWAGLGFSADALTFPQLQDIVSAYYAECIAAICDLYALILSFDIWLWWEALVGWIHVLELLEYRLQRAGTKAVKLSGGMGVAQRDAVLTAFKEDPDVSVILISLKAGGVALNLTVASHIFLMDPWWNPAAEYQAIDRAHRIGQHKPIKAVRFIIRNTVEERILRLQDKKRLVFEGTVGGDAASLAQLSEDDLRFLFQN